MKKEIVTQPAMKLIGLEKKLNLDHFLEQWTHEFRLRQLNSIQESAKFELFNDFCELKMFKKELFCVIRKESGQIIIFVGCVADKFKAPPTPELKEVALSEQRYEKFQIVINEESPEYEEMKKLIVDPIIGISLLEVPTNILFCSEEKRRGISTFEGERTGIDFEHYYYDDQRCLGCVDVYIGITS